MAEAEDGMRGLAAALAQMMPAIDEVERNAAMMLRGLREAAGGTEET